MGWAATSVLSLATLILEPTVFRIQPRVVQRGQAVTVAWNVLDARAVWLSGRGRVPSAGSWTYTPDETTTLILAVERDHEPTFLTDTVIVRGSRGDDDVYVALDEQMPFARSTQSRKPFVDTLEATSNQLRTTLSMPLRQLLVDGAYVFVTRKAPLHLKMAPPRRGVREWRVGWRAKVVSNPPHFNQATIDIECRAEYRLRGKEKWLLESDPTLYEQELLPVAATMLQALR